MASRSVQKTPRKRTRDSSARAAAKHPGRANADTAFERRYAGWGETLTNDDSKSHSQSNHDLRRQLIGVDEAGRGCLGGPVVCGACAFVSPPRLDVNDAYVIRDSKIMSAAQRERTAAFLRSCAASQVVYAVTACSPRYIDEHNILQATFAGMKRCVRSVQAQLAHLRRERSLRLQDCTDTVLIDGNRRPPWAADTAAVDGIRCPTNYVCETTADLKSITVAAASILAKHMRDSMMTHVYHARFPEYAFPNHCGYPSKLHRERLVQHGARRGCHRVSFRGVPAFVEGDSNSSDNQEMDLNLETDIHALFPEVSYIV